MAPDNTTFQTRPRSPPRVNNCERAPVANAAGLPEHPQRRNLLAEVHARPIVALRAPQHLTHLALWAGFDEHERELAHIGALCREMAIAQSGFRLGAVEAYAALVHALAPYGS